MFDFTTKKINFFLLPLGIGLLAIIIALMIIQSISYMKLSFSHLRSTPPQNEVVATLKNTPVLERGDLMITLIDFQVLPPQNSEPLIAVVDDKNIAVHKFITPSNNQEIIASLIKKKLDKPRLIWRNWSKLKCTIAPVVIHVLTIRDSLLFALCAVFFTISSISFLKEKKEA